MMKTRTELTDLFQLSSVVVHAGKAEAVDAGLRIRTPQQPWAFSAALPLQLDFLPKEPAAVRPVIVVVRAKVERGSVAIGCLPSDLQVYIDEAVRTQEDGLTEFPLRVDSLKDCAWLMVRNGPAEGVGSEIVIHEISVFERAETEFADTYIFDHVYKTAGTTFHQSYLSAAFRNGEKAILSGFLEQNKSDLTHLASLPAEKKRSFKIIAGHNAGRLRSSYPDARVITVARDPVQRVISAYLHARYFPGAWETIGREISETNCGLAEFVVKDLNSKKKNDLLHSVHDGQAHALLGPHFDKVDWNNEGEIARILRSRFHLIGYTEALELFLFLLHVTESFPLVLFNNRLVNPMRQAFQPTAEDLETIEQHTRADTIVYRSARREFERRVREVWSDELEHDFRSYLAALEKFRRHSQGDTNQTLVYRY